MKLTRYLMYLFVKSVFVQTAAELNFIFNDAGDKPLKQRTSQIYLARPFFASSEAMEEYLIFSSVCKTWDHERQRKRSHFVCR